MDGIRYEEIFITSFDGDVLGLHEHLGEYESIDELNYLAVLLSEMDQSDIEKFEADIDAGEYTGSVKDLINLTQNLDCFEFYPDVHSDEELGRMYVLEFGGVEVPEHLIDYIDYEAYGRDMRINDSGHYAPDGYVADNRSHFIEHYTGRDDIPDEYRVFFMPKLSIREQMSAFMATSKTRTIPASGWSIPRLPMWCAVSTAWRWRDTDWLKPPPLSVLMVSSILPITGAARVQAGAAPRVPWSLPSGATPQSRKS